MKKIIILLVTLLLVTGCGQQTLNNLNIEKASAAVETTLKNMEQIEKETLEDVYGLDFSSIEEYVVKQNTDGDLYAIIKTSDVTSVKDNMNEFFSKIEQFNEAYSPQRLQILEDRLEKEIGNYLIYVVAENSEKIYTDVTNTME